MEIESREFCMKQSPSGKSTCYLDKDHTGFHYAPCSEHGDVSCGHQEIWMYSWSIRQKSTGFYLPARKGGRGFTFDEPTKDCFPRLFKSELSASRALSAWLQGQWKREYHTREVGGFPEDVEYLIADKVEGRDRDNMEIVEFVLFEVAK